MILLKPVGGFRLLAFALQEILHFFPEGGIG